jgi:hypothetical protein
VLARKGGVVTIRFRNAEDVILPNKVGEYLQNLEEALRLSGVVYKLLARRKYGLWGHKFWEITVAHDVAKAVRLALVAFNFREI